MDTSNDAAAKPIGSRILAGLGKAGAILLILMVGAIASAIVRDLLSSAEKKANAKNAQTAIDEAATKLNVSLPMKVDAVTQLDRVVAEDKALRYIYTLSGDVGRTADESQIRLYLEPNLITQYCTSASLEAMRRNSITMRYEYRNEIGQKIAEISVGGSTCGSQNPR